MPLRATSSDETSGLDVTQHGEEAYIHSSGVSGVPTEGASGAGIRPLTETPAHAR